MTVVASAGGVAGNFQGTLTMKRCVVADNRVVGTPPLGDTASAAGVDAHGALAIEDSVVSRNSAELSTDDPTDEFPLAFAGGIGIGGQATITRTAVNDNSVNVSNVGGQALAVAGGILDEGSLVLTHSAIERNRASATVPDSSHDTAVAGAGGMEVDGAAAIRDSRFVGNSVAASAPAGSASAVGGGISNFGQTTLERTLVTANTASASGATGFAHGGGILNDTLFGSTPSLTATDTVIAANRLLTGPGIPAQGGGLYTTFPVTLSRTVIAGNRPDQCFGC